MADIHQVKCDKCGRIADKINGAVGWHMCNPIGWKIIEMKDFCPKCAKIIKLKFKEMLND